MISLKGRIAATLLSGALKLLPNLVASSSSSMSRVVGRVAVHLWRIQPHVHVLPFKDRTKNTDSGIPSSAPLNVLIKILIL